MSIKHFVILAIALLFFAGISFAVQEIGTSQYRKACMSCAFDGNGKMNEECWKSYEDQGRVLLGAAYPVTSTKYMFGACPQVDTCVARLQACKAAASTGNDANDCSSAGVMACFKMGDICMDAANQICADGKTEEEAGFNEKDAGAVNFTKQTKEDEDELIYDEDDLLDLLCEEPAMILALVLGGAFFTKRQ